MGPSWEGAKTVRTRNVVETGIPKWVSVRSASGGRAWNQENSGGTGNFAESLP